MTTMISTLIALPYEIARRPLVLVDQTLADRLEETSGPRVLLDRTIGSADKLAGGLLRNRDLAQRGVERLERSEKLVTASRLDLKAESRREQAQETARTGRQQATSQRKAAQDRASSGLAEADVAEARGKQEAKAEAARAAAEKKAVADREAAKRTHAVEERKERVETVAEAKKRAAQREAKSELEDVRDAKQSAAEARADADRLNDLAKAKKTARKQD